MSDKPPIDSPLSGKTVALPESRQLDVLAALFERRQSRVLRVPMVTILDSPDQQAVIEWIRAFINKPPQLFIILTGEGLRRLLAAAKRNGMEEQFLIALSAVQKLCRGPKPVKALKEIGLKADLLGEIPTTEGIIETLKSLDLSGIDVAVQLYGTDPNLLLIDFLRSSAVNEISSVAPYIYAEDSDSAKVINLINQIYAGNVDLLAFTSKPQVKRLFTVAKQNGLDRKLAEGLTRTFVAAIGPVVEKELQNHNVKVSIAPESHFSMKPFVRSVETLFT